MSNVAVIFGSILFIILVARGCAEFITDINEYQTSLDVCEAALKDQKMKLRIKKEVVR